MTLIHRTAWRIVLIVLVVLVVLPSVGCRTARPAAPSAPAVREPLPGPTPAAEPNPAEGSTPEVIWTCPMHPEISRPGPGKCPICGMELVAVSRSPGGTKPSPGSSPEREHSDSPHSGGGHSHASVGGHCG